MRGPLTPLVAELGASVDRSWNWNLFGWHFFLVVVYVLLGLAIFAISFLILDKLTPFSFRKELLEEHNTALAIVLASIFLGIAIILAAAIVG